MTDKVGFFIVGTQRAGTTALMKHLLDHPAIYISQRKEIHFFDQDEFFNGGPPDYAAYHEHALPDTDNDDGRVVVGEATPIYMWWRPALRRIHEYNPQARLICILRHPVERAYSHWCMETDLGMEYLSFTEVVAQEDIRAEACRPEQDRFYSYMARGFYVDQLQRLFRFFDADQVRIIRYEDFLTDPAGVLWGLYSFLGLDPRLATVRLRPGVNAAPYPAPLDPGFRRELIDQFYAAEIRALEKMLGWDLKAWLC